MEMIWSNLKEIRSKKFIKTVYEKDKYKSNIEIRINKIDHKYILANLIYVKKIV